MLFRSIGVVSFKGGVGKTSSVVALGDTLSKLGKKVLIVDGDLSSPNLGMHFNILDAKKSLSNVLLGKIKIEEAIHTINGLDILPSFLFNKYKLSPLKLKEKLKSLRKLYDLILIDSPSALNEESLAVWMSSDSLIFVTTPDYPTVARSEERRVGKECRSRWSPYH